jgi:hypothetical protein
VLKKAKGLWIGEEGAELSVTSLHEAPSMTVAKAMKQNPKIIIAGALGGTEQEVVSVCAGLLAGGGAASTSVLWVPSSNGVCNVVFLCCIN